MKVRYVVLSMILAGVLGAQGGRGFGGGSFHAPHVGANDSERSKYVDEVLYSDNVSGF